MPFRAWAETIRNHCSVVVVNSGKFEFIGIRHRKSQTMYITDIFKPSKPGEGIGYGEIHIGLYISALLDAMERERQGTHPLWQSAPTDSGSAVELDDFASKNSDSGNHSDSDTYVQEDVDMDDDTLDKREAKGKIVRTKGSYVEVLESFSNIAPIVDAVLADTDNSGQVYSPAHV